MAHYRRTEMVVEAVQWFPDVYYEGIRQVVQYHDDLELMETGGTKRGQITVRGGYLYADAGDWIVTGHIGEKYICEDSLFRLTYAPTDD